MRTTKYLLILLSLLFMPTLCSAQDAKEMVRERRVSAQGEEVGPGDVVRIETDLVPVEVTVRDAVGQTVPGLRSNDFRLFEDGVEQLISFFSAEAAGGAVKCPLDLVFALDVSGSMKRDEMEMLHVAASLFTAHLSGPRSRFAVITFGMKAKLRQSLTDDRRKLAQAFDSAIEDEMGLSTHAYDAVDDAVRLLARQGRKTSGGLVVKRVVVVISDGFPTGDTVSPRLVIERANAASVSVYTVTMPSFSFNYAAAAGGRALPTILDLSGLAEKTGGVNAYVTDRNYTAALEAISREVLSRYVLAFYPDRGNRRDGSFHKLHVKVPDGMTVSQSRQGYTGKGLN
ncbi:MAG TPA: VWA domain-containing protein [Pyrinomonadaceae bacterium]|jgi:VWFA-related protein